MAMSPSTHGSLYVGLVVLRFRELDGCVGVMEFGHADRQTYLEMLELVVSTLSDDEQPRTLTIITTGMCRMMCYGMRSEGSRYLFGAGEA